MHLRSFTSSTFCAASYALFASRRRCSSFLNPSLVTRLGCSEIGRSGSWVSDAVSALSSFVKATLKFYSISVYLARAKAAAYPFFLWPKSHPPEAFGRLPEQTLLGLLETYCSTIATRIRCAFKQTIRMEYNCASVTHGRTKIT